jgi:hypothetical protein
MFGHMRRGIGGKAPPTGQRRDYRISACDLRHFFQPPYQRASSHDFCGVANSRLASFIPVKIELFAQNGRQAHLDAGFQPMRINFFRALWPRRISMEDFVTPK